MNKALSSRLNAIKSNIDKLAQEEDKAFKDLILALSSFEEANNKAVILPHFFELVMK